MIKQRRRKPDCLIGIECLAIGAQQGHRQIVVADKRIPELPWQCSKACR
jgi:hypothetical protein